jgi:hypothetical protein
VTEQELKKLLGEKRAACPGCGAKIGEVHGACDIERCPRCGDQAIGCDCIYVVCGMDPATLETEYPDIYTGGPTPEMVATWEKEWGPRRMKWEGWWPGEVEAVELGFWVCWGPDMNPPQRGWVRVKAGTPGARPGLNELVENTDWNPETQRRVLRGIGDA